LERAKGVVDLYLDNIIDPKNRSASGNARFRGLTDQALRDNLEFLVQSENLDLSLLNKSAADLVYRRYRETVLDLDQTFTQLGMPSMSLPSESPYRHFLRYIVDPFANGDPKNGIHPMTLNLMRTSYNPTHDAVSTEDFATGRNRMRSPWSLQRLHERSKKFFPEGVPTSYADSLSSNKPMNHLAFDRGRTYTVITWDTETTGLTPESQIREIALVKRTVSFDADGKMVSSAPEVLTSKSFASDLMDIAGMIDERGETIPLSKAAFLSERGGIVSTDELAKFEKAYKDGGVGAVADFKEILKLFTNQDDVLGIGPGVGNLRIEGHNAEAFDLDKLIGTLQRLPAFQEDDEAKGLLKNFLNLRSSESSYMLDTLDSAKIAIGMQQAELQRIMRESGLELSEDLQHGLLSSFSISPEMFGGAKGTESLENLFLNTNFFELLEQRAGKEGLDTLTGLMETRGTHTAEVDTMLNAYISDFINNNELRIRRLPTAGMPPAGLTEEAAAEYTSKHAELEKLFKSHGFMKENRSMTAFEKFMRARIRRSSAVTPITNISDMTRVSDDVFNFLKTEPGMQKISMSVNPDYLARLESQGINLGIRAENIPDEASAGRIYFDSERGKYVFSNFESRGVAGAGAGFQELDTANVKSAFDFALRESKQGKALSERINIGAGGSISVNPSTEALSNIGITEIEATELDQMMRARKGLGSLGTPRSLPTDVAGLSEALGTTSELYGLKGGGYAPAIVGKETARYSQALIDRGLPYATYDVRSRILASVEAKATSGIGRTLINRASAAGDTTYSTLVGKDLSKLSDVGIQFTIAQGKEDIFGLARRTKTGDTFPIDPNSYFRTPVSGTTKKASRVIVNADDLSQLMIREFNEDGTIKNVTKFGSKEFIENANLNRFVDSTVQAADAELGATINRAFVPKNLSRATVEDLAEQVLSGNIRAYDRLKSVPGSFINTQMQEEAQALAKNIFGQQELTPTELTGRIQQLTEMSRESTQEARLAALRGFAKNEEEEKLFVQNYRKTVGTVANEIEKTGVIGMKITGDAAVETINEARLTQGITGVRDTDVALKGRTHRLINTIQTADDGVIGYEMSGSVTDDMDMAARTLLGETVDAGVARAAEDAAAHTALINAGSLADAITPTAAGVNEGEKFASEAIAVGRKIYESNKGKLALGALALAGAVTGYKMAKRGNENDLYDATMGPAPIEEGQRPYGIQEALMGNGQTSRRRDPLFTAGVVGNLDRQKIGHTSMGSNKHSHLFGDR